MGFEMSTWLTLILLPFLARQSYAGFCTTVCSILAIFGWFTGYIFGCFPRVSHVAMVFIHEEKIFQLGDVMHRVVHSGKSSAKSRLEPCNLLVVNGRDRLCRIKNLT